MQYTIQMIWISPKIISRTVCSIYLSENCDSIEKEKKKFLILLKTIIINYKKDLKEKNRYI